MILGISFTLSPGEIITLEGSSGIGKTRMLKAIAQLDAPVQGELRFLDNSETASQNGPLWRQRCIYVPQVYLYLLIPFLS